VTLLDLMVDEVLHAQADLSDFVRSEPAQTAAELGFGWRPAELAPSGLDELTAEFRACHLSGLPIRVYRHASDDTVYDRPETNWAFRFLHDSRHVWIGADFSIAAELDVASCHLARAKASGIAPGTLAFNLLLADTVGQTLYAAQTQRFVQHQLRFALDCVTGGLDEAIAREIHSNLRQTQPVVGGKAT
jgi:hypothetical protein